MPHAPDLAGLAALIGEPARARMLMSLMGGSALTATELALEADVAPSTASAHLARLTEGRVLAIEKQGRHRYFRLFDSAIAELLEELIGVAARNGHPRRRTGPADPVLRRARVCYDHLAGERGVWLLAQLRERKVLDGRDALTPGGESFLADFGIDVDALAASRRPLCRPCLDWSERRHHLGGSLGAALLARMFALQWARREEGGRAVLFTRSGEAALQRSLSSARI